MPEYEHVMVVDKDTKAHYPMIRSAAEAEPGVQILKESPFDENGELKAGYLPETTTSGQPAETKKDK